MQLILDSFLEKKIKEVGEIQINASLELGKIFTEVHARIGNKGNGIYTQWLKHTGYTPEKAMSHRKRFYLFGLAKTHKGKEVIKNSSSKVIDFISSQHGTELRSIMSKVDKGISQEEIKEIADNSVIDITEKKKKKITMNDFVNIKSLKKIKNSEELARYKRKLNEYKKIIKEAEKEIKNKDIELQHENNLKLDTLK